MSTPHLPRWNEIEVVLLDMDGTVLDLAFDNYFWRELVPEEYARLKGLTLVQAQEWLDPHFRGLQGQLEWYCLDHWSGLTGMDMAMLTAQVRERIAPLPGSEDFLQSARASGREVWLVTNAHRGSWELKMEHTGFALHFDRILCSHDFGVPKEDARFWPAMRAQNPFNAERALFVDDSLPVLRAARDFGIGQVLAIRHPDSKRPKREIEEFDAVDRLVDLLPVPPWVKA